MIRLEDVGHVYAAGTPWARRALSGVDLTIAHAERILVVGPNGSGKSTLAWIVAGLLRPTEGTATLDGRPVDEAPGSTAMTFQHARLQLFRPTVGADVRFGTRLDRVAVDHALEMVGLDPAVFRSRRVDELSGGQQRRVALAGALVRRPRVLVLDEPLAGLDASGRRLLIAVLARLNREAQVATVIVTHDTEDAHRVADRGVVLRAGEVVADDEVASALEQPRP
ncbi:MAG TPA: ATP-binding cassette domain-containing protein [Acidimicrobiales bacterium]|nr:ATP-binding cassette domain-containing protein [Acidimicrobiales bacterium]